MLTLAHGVSLWDAGEYIACAANLNVGHPPGNPLYLLCLRIVCLLAPPDYVAHTCNMLSTLTSAAAAAVLCLFVKGLIALTRPHTDARLASLAALTTSFSWSFMPSVWDVSTETEVYTAAALMAFCMLHFAVRWTLTSDTRYLYLISFFAGLSCGVHRLSLLALPVVGHLVGMSGLFAVTVRNRKISSSLIGTILGSLAVVILLWLSSGAAFALGTLLDVVAVNTFSLSVGSGLLFGTLFILTTLFAWSHRQPQILHLALVYTGLLPLLLPLFRAQQGCTFSFGHPADAQALTEYLQMKAYGSRPLFYGPTYTSVPSDTEILPHIAYDADSNRYVARRNRWDYVYPSTEQSLFPRMLYSDDASLAGYTHWTQRPIATDRQPSATESLVYTLRYQLWHMMTRYILWNTCGRQNDRIGDGDNRTGNAITGFDFLDRHLLGDQLFADHGTIRLFCIPLLLMFVGLWVILHDRRLTTIIFLLFIIVGPALALYLNMQPFEPRERDYVFILLYAAVGICIGFATLSVKRYHHACLLFLLVPIGSAASAWHAMDKHNDTLTDNIAESILNLCPHNAVLLTNADNNFYPILYAQEVRHIRRDVQLVNLHLLSTPWHANDICRSRYAEPPLRMHFADLITHELLSLSAIGADSTPQPISRARLTDLGGDMGYQLTTLSDKILIPTTDSTYIVSVDPSQTDINSLLLLDLMEQNPHRKFCAVPSVLPSDIDLSAHIVDCGPITYIEPDTAKLPRLLCYQLCGLISLPDGFAHSHSASEVDELNRLQFRRLSILAAREALKIGDRTGARNVLREGLSWLPTQYETTDTCLVTMAELLHSADDDYIARQILADIATAIARGSISPSNDYLDRLAHALQLTDNQDIANSLIHFLTTQE